jgi:hypothetical protein
MISKHDPKNLNLFTPEPLNPFAAQSKIKNPKSKIRFASLGLRSLGEAGSAR